MAYREFEQPKVRDLRPADYGVLGHMLGGVEKFPDFDYGAQERAKLHAEAEKAKRLLTYKLDPKSIYFTQDGFDQQQDIDRGINNINNEIDPKEENLKMEQRSLASKQQYDAVTAQLTPVTSKDNVIVADDNVIKAYQTSLNQVDYKKRPEYIIDFNKKLKESPSSIYNTQASNGKWLGGINLQEVITSKKTQAGLSTFDTDLTTKGKFFIPTKEVIKDAQGKDMFDADGVTPLYKQKRITDVNEARTALDRMELSGAIPEQLIVLNADKAYKDPTINQQIEDELKQFSTTVLNNDGTVDENAVNNRREALKREAGKDFIANAMLNDEKASDITPKISTSVTKREATAEEKKASRQYTGRIGDKNQPEQTVRIAPRLYGARTIEGGRDLGVLRQYTPISFELRDDQGKLIGKNAKINPQKGIYSTSKGYDVEVADIPTNGDYNGTHYLITTTGDKGNKIIDVTKETDHVKRVAELRKKGYDVSVEPYESFNVYSAKNPFSSGTEKDEYAKLLKLKKKGKDTDELRELESKFAKNVDEIFVPAEKSTVSRFNEDNVKLLYASGDKKTIEKYEGMKNAIEKTTKGNLEETLKSQRGSLAYNQKAHAYKDAKDKQAWLDANNMKVVDNRLVPKSQQPVTKPKEAEKTKSPIINPIITKQSR